MESDERPSLFPNAKIANDGIFLSPQGTNVSTIFVDLSGEVERPTLSLVKATEPAYALTTAPTIRLSRPGVFRDRGEVLIRDDQEGRARVSSNLTSNVSNEDAELSRERISALNAALKLCRTKGSVNSSERHTRSASSRAAVTFGGDWLIYCTSMRPSKDEEEAWRRTLPDGYTHMTPIYRPTQFAQGLGLGVCEHIGVRGKAHPTRGEFEGFRTVEVPRKGQMVLHGPMLYVDNPYQVIEQAQPGWEKIWAMVFLKSRELDYAAQEEYRFAMLSIGPEVGETFDLPMTGMLRDCLTPVRYPEGTPEETVEKVTRNHSPVKEEVTGRTYTYSRRYTERKQSNSNAGDAGSGTSSEEVIEENRKVLQVQGMRVFNAFCASIKLALSGYGHASTVLLRAALETIFLLDLFSSDGAAIERWRTAEPREQEQQVLVLQGARCARRT